MILCSSRRGSWGIDLRWYLGARDRVKVLDSVSKDLVLDKTRPVQPVYAAIDLLRAVEGGRGAHLTLLVGVVTTELIESQ